MDLVFQLVAATRAWWPLAVTLLISVSILAGTHWILLGRHENLSSEKRFARQLIMFGLTVTAIAAVVLAMPIPEGLKGQVLGFMGLLLSGAFAFSSTTIFANLMAGIMLRVTRPFTIGDFIRVQGFFGRVYDRGLLDTGIQTESREFVSIPNAVFIQNPVSVIRKSGTLISCTVTLGYDVHHATVEKLMLDAARNAGLDEAFVIIDNLGDFSVAYRVSGLLTEVSSLVSARSKLSSSVLDSLHGAGVEIVSPNFMNQRVLDPDVPVIPKADWRRSGRQEEKKRVEDVAFDKAETAATAYAQRKQILVEIDQLKTQLNEAPDKTTKKQIEARLQALDDALKAIPEPDADAEERKVSPGEPEEVAGTNPDTQERKDVPHP
ncbi:mechanosensitive ion channel domain-containing protein [Hahella sp. SMD15-11]|uniref:Small-conductance mechanosensitive channel n=1 Tax=Thermohahella caldifontis TaxID=3142973 RepID=A0AB39UW15_9GAMM